MAFGCSVERSGDVVVVTPTDDIDLDNADALRQIMQDAVATDGVRRIEVHLGKVTFLDSTGLGVFVAAHRAAEERGATLALVDPGPVVRMVLEVTDLFELLVTDPARADDATADDATAHDATAGDGDASDDRL
jgi:anti-sigma B factor antagonist